MSDINNLYAILNISSENNQLIEQALTHSSFANEQGKKKSLNITNDLNF